MGYKDKDKQREYNRQYYKGKPASARQKFNRQKRNSIKRQIPFLLSFEEWWKIWEDSGHWLDRGINGYHMCRINDIGPYSIDNVYIAHHLYNRIDNTVAQKHKLLTKVITETPICVECQLILKKAIEEYTKKYKLELQERIDL